MDDRFIMNDDVKISLDEFEWAVFLYNNTESDAFYFYTLSDLEANKIDGKPGKMKRLLDI